MKDCCQDGQRTFYVKTKGARVESIFGCQFSTTFLRHTTKCSQKKEKVESRPYDDDSLDYRPSFTDAVKPPPVPGSVAFNKAHPSLDEALAQNPKAQRLIAKSSQDNLAAVAGNTAPSADMNVPPPFLPPGAKAGVGAITKSSSTVMRTEETAMETDATSARVVQSRPPVPPP